MSLSCCRGSSGLYHGGTSRGVLKKALARLQEKSDALGTAARKDELLRNVVVKLAPAFRPEDAHDPKKVAQALHQLGKDHIVFTRSVDIEHEYEPGHRRQHYMNQPDARGGEAVYVEQNDAGIFLKREEYPRSLPAGTSGLAWSTVERDGGTRVVFTTLSGGRYIVDPGGLTNQRPEKSALNAEPVNLDLLERDIILLSEQGVLPAKLGTAVQSKQKAFESCAEGLWGAYDSKFDKVQQSNISQHTKDARTKALNGEVRRKLDAKCGKHQKAFIKAWMTSQSQWTALRHKLARETVK